MIPVPVGDIDVWVGENHLGRILELIRDFLRIQHPAVSNFKPYDRPPYHQSIDEFIEDQLLKVEKIETTLRNVGDDQRINDAVDLAWRYGNIEGDHHQKWVIDQILRRLLTENEYARFIHDYEESGEYKWDLGIAP